MGFKEIVSENILGNLDTNQLIYRIILSILIVLVGIFLGKIVYVGLKKISKKLEFEKKIRGSFIDLLFSIIKWSIYIIFFILAINRIEIPGLTDYVTNILITIPAFVGSLILLAIGFAIAIYLREIIEDAEVTGWDLISKVIFYFVLYIFGIYALRTALFSLDEQTKNMITIIITGIITAGLVYVNVKKFEKKNN